MTPWQWWAAEEQDAACGEWTIGECESREEIINLANHELPAGARYRIIEARSSTSLAYEGADIVPFLRTRSAEQLVAAGPCPL